MTLQKDLDRQDHWAVSNCMTFNRAKWQEQHMGHTTTPCSGIGLRKRPESSPAKKDLGVMVNSCLNMSQQCAPVAKKLNGILVCIRNSRISKMIVHLYLALSRPLS